MTQCQTKLQYINKKTINQVDHEIWRNILRLRSEFNLTLAQRYKLLKICRKTINNFYEVSELQFDVCLAFEKNHLLFVTLIYNNQILGCASTPGKNIYQSAYYSTLKALKSIPGIDKIPKKLIHLEINIYFNKRIIDNSSIVKLKNSIALGLDGISLEHKEETTFLKNTVPVFHGYNLNEILTILAKKIDVSYHHIFDKNFKIAVYNTIEFREDFHASKKTMGILDTIRGNPIILQKEVTQKKLLSSLKIGSITLKKFLDFDFPAYQYNVSNKKWIFDQTPVALLRILSTLEITIQLSRYLKDHELLEKTKTALLKIMGMYFKEEAILAYLEINGIKDIGLSGILLSNLILLNAQTYQIQIKKLFNFICASYDPINKKLIPFLNQNVTWNLDAELTLPGLALKALADYYSIYNDIRSLMIAKNIFDFYYSLFSFNDEGLKMISWMTYSYSKFYIFTKNVFYKNFVFEMIEKILPLQIESGDSNFDLIGSFSPIGNSLVTSTLVNCLLEAKKIAINAKETRRVKIYNNAIKMALRFIIQSQYRIDNTYDENCLGGFKNHLFDRNIRIDNLQHNLSAILNYLI